MVFFKTGDLLKKVYYIYDIFYDGTRKWWPLNTGDCLIEVTARASLTVLTLMISGIICPVMGTSIAMDIYNKG